MDPAWQKVVDEIKDKLSAVNDIYQTSFDILKVDPFDEKIQSALGTVSTPIKAIALTLVSLFFVIQLCNDAMYLKIRSYENVFKLIFKFFLAKALVDNASGLMGIVYNEFTKISISINTTMGGIIEAFTPDSVLTKPDEAGFMNINYTTASMWATVDILILKAACWVISLILIGRLFEVVIYATVAPIPLATVAGEGWSDSSKTFIKGFAAVCLQSVIIVIMFNVFGGITQLMTTPAAEGAPAVNNLGITVTTLSLAMGVAKSGQWARTAVGMG